MIDFGRAVQIGQYIEHALGRSGPLLENVTKRCCCVNADSYQNQETNSNTKILGEKWTKLGKETCQMG